MSLHLDKSARNEGRKLVANTANTLGLAVFGLGVLTPAFAGNGSGLTIVLSSVIFVMSHAAAHIVLQRLED
jgi:hypothetical protein